MNRFVVLFLLLSVVIGCAASKLDTHLVPTDPLDTMVEWWGDPDNVLVEDGNIHYYWSSVSIDAVKSLFGEIEVSVSNIEKAYNLHIFDGGIVFSDSSDASGVISIQRFELLSR